VNLDLDGGRSVVMSLTSTASSPEPLTLCVEPDVAAVPSTRHRVTETVRGWQVPLSEGALQDVGLCASEVLTNAVEHTGAGFRVLVHWANDRLRVEVSDHSTRPPRLVTAQATATGGRGLVLVAGLSHSWGWRPERAGKTVWFEFLADKAAADQ
jgi:anti-sigma regulatory factor (Ser/Thr protein kinase)